MGTTLGGLGRIVAPLIVAAAVALANGPSFAEGDPSEGEALFRSCKACHQIGAGALNGVGPHLDALFGRTAGSLDGFRYSSAMRDRGTDGLVWDERTLDAYLEKPQTMVPGTRMSFRGIPDPEARTHLIAYLKQASASAPAADPTTAPAPRPEMATAVLEIEGDPAYGEYLASECVTCHQPSGRAEGIPSIVGWPKDAFIRALFEYKTNVRSHQVMRMITTNLGNEEVAALAAYFEKLEPQ
ncbi:c-type cytochrome [Microbaculum sp. FT89]|uniref:c-type cytochrome n=1 Tax=Microbaculum sp. FT89 TaxID=3447298 RepID=UPI003F52A5E2